MFVPTQSAPEQNVSEQTAPEKNAPELARTYDHPTLGPLPEPWQLRHDPPTANPVGTDEPEPADPVLASTAVPQLNRLRISATPLDARYKRVGTIDKGGKVGGMNVGIHVVRKLGNGKLYVQKDYRTISYKSTRMAKFEIFLVKDLKHCNLVHYHEAYMRIDPSFEASVYMEYCDRGSLKDMIAYYEGIKKNRRAKFAPESFLWSAYISLIDALYYLRTGKTIVTQPLDDSHTREIWKPLIHADIKPDNILIKSRLTPGSKAMPYVLLTDFGIAQYDIDGQVSTEVCGTPEYQAPELCWDPYPITPYMRQHLFNAPSAKTDVWAVAASLYCLCERDQYAHMNRRACGGPPVKLLRTDLALGRPAKRTDLIVTGTYSSYLANNLRWGALGDPAARPNAEALLLALVEDQAMWEADPSCKKKVKKAFPDYAAPPRNWR